MGKELDLMMASVSPRVREKVRAQANERGVRNLREQLKFARAEIVVLLGRLQEPPPPALRSGTSPAGDG